MRWSSLPLLQIYRRGAAERAESGGGREGREGSEGREIERESARAPPSVAMQLIDSVAVGGAEDRIRSVGERQQAGRELSGRKEGRRPERTAGSWSGGQAVRRGREGRDRAAFGLHRLAARAGEVAGRDLEQGWVQAVEVVAAVAEVAE